MSEQIENLITKIVQGKSAEAEQDFANIISQKASDAIAQLRTETTDKMFGQGQYNESVIAEGGGGIASLKNAPAAAAKLGLDKIPGKSTVRNSDGTTTVTKTDANGKVTKTVTKG